MRALPVLRAYAPGSFPVGELGPLRSERLCCRDCLPLALPVEAAPAVRRDAQRPVGEGDAAEAGATEPGATEPGATEPGATEPGATEPGAGGREVQVWAAVAGGRVDEVYVWCEDFAPVASGNYRCEECGAVWQVGNLDAAWHDEADDRWAPTLRQRLTQPRWERVEFLLEEGRRSG